MNTTIATQKYPTFSYIGGATICYLDLENQVICADCANEDTEEDYTDRGFIHGEGESLYCDRCDKELKSEYGIPEED